MANFDWLNDIPDVAWDSTDGGGMRLHFPHDVFLDRCGIQEGESWRKEFDIWGESQQRRYSQFAHPTHVQVLANPAA